MPLQKTKILCTLGPASETFEQISALAEAGMSLARINFSHGTYEQHAAKLEAVKKLNETRHSPIAVITDLSGPKLRIGMIPEGPIMLEDGATLVLTKEQVDGTAECLSVSLPQLVDDLKVGDELLLHDGIILLQVIAKRPGELVCQVVNGGPLSSRQGINVPKTELSIPSVTQKDRQDLEFALSAGVDWISLSFVRSARDIEILRYLISSAGYDTPIVAKIEKAEAVEDIDAIIEATDAVMVARGDLGVEIPIEQVPMVQKSIIRKCVEACKPVITATQMLESMVENLGPTRAEVTDVANAILDGSDAVMLAEETAVGEHPSLATSTMRKLAATAEENLAFLEFFERASRQPNMNTAEAVAQSACQLAYELDAKAIVAPTSSGLTPARITKYRPKSPIIAVTHNEHIQRRLQLWFGVIPLRTRPASTVDELLAGALECSVAAGLLSEGDLVIMVGGVPVGHEGATNFLKVHVVGEQLIGHES